MSVTHWRSRPKLNRGCAHYVRAEWSQVASKLKFSSSAVCTGEAVGRPITSRAA